MSTHTAIEVSGSPEVAPRLLKGRVLRGWNVHYRSTVFVQPVELGGIAGMTTAELGADYATRFAARFADLPRFVPGGCIEGSFLERLESATGVPIEEALLEAVLAVERSAACSMRRLDRCEFAKIVRRSDAPGLLELVWECPSPGIVRSVARAAFTGWLELLPERLVRGRRIPKKNFSERMRDLHRRSHRDQFSTNTAVLALAAKRRGLSFEPLAGAYLRLGEGVRQQVISATPSGQFAPSTTTASTVPGTGVVERPGHLADGSSYRLLVVRGRLISAIRVDAPVGAGDERTTIGELIEDVTDQVHADHREAALRAASERELEISEVELTTSDIGSSKPWRVIAVRSQPELIAHALPGVGPPREDVGIAALELRFPHGDSASVPTALVVGQRGAGSLARHLDVVLRASGRTAGLATNKLTLIGGKPVDPTSIGSAGGARFLLGDPRVEAVVGAISPRRIVDRGLRLDRTTVTAILDREPDGDETIYRLGTEVAVAATTAAVVIGADNPCAAHLDASRLILVSARPTSSRVADHLAAGGRAIVREVRNGVETLELRQASEGIASLALSTVLSGRSGGRRRRIAAAMFAIALAQGLGLSGSEIVSALERRRYLRR